MIPSHKFKQHFQHPMQILHALAVVLLHVMHAFDTVAVASSVRTIVSSLGGSGGFGNSSDIILYVIIKKSKHKHKHTHTHKHGFP
jgi:hypothetical protein